MSTPTPTPQESPRLDLALHAGRRGTGRPLAGFLPVLQWGLREHLRPKKLLLAFGLAVLLGFAGAWVVQEGVGPFRTRDRVFLLWEMLDIQVLQVLVPLIALLLVGPGYSRELRQRTLVYHLVRPVSRTTVLLARYVAGVVPAALVAIVLYLSTLAFSGVDVPGSVWRAVPVTAFFGVAVLGAVYYMLAAVFRRGLIIGLLYTFVAEGVIAGLPGTIQKLSVRFHLRSLHHGMSDNALAALSARVARDVEKTRPEGSGDVMDVVVGRVPYEPVDTAILTLVLIAVGVLAFAIYKIRRRDFALKD